MSHANILVQAVLALAACGCSTTHTHEVLDDVSGIEAAKRAFFESWTKEEGTAFTLEKLSQAVETSEDFVSFDGATEGRPVIAGWKEYASVWGPAMNEFESASLTEARPVATWIGDDTAITASIAHIRIGTNDGAQIDLRAQLTLGYRRHDGGWRVVHEHISVDPGG
jgi:ketosteroid isomerase-like protein